MIFKTLESKKEETKEEIYIKSADYFLKNKIIQNKNKFLEELTYRENLGSIKIYKDFYLPHIISKNILKTTILRITKNKEKILFILLKENDNLSKEKIKILIKNLLSREYIEKIFSLSNYQFEKIKIK